LSWRNESSDAGVIGGTARGFNSLAVAWRFARSEEEIAGRDSHQCVPAAMNRILALQLTLYSLLLVGLSAWAYFLNPVIARTTLVVGCAGGP
jgi:hypothetical protein